MFGLLIKLLAISLNFIVFAVVVQFLSKVDAANLLLLFGFAAIAVPLCDFGYSRYSFVKIIRGVGASVIHYRLMGRLALFAPILFLMSFIFGYIFDINFWHLFISAFIASSSIFLNVVRYIFVRDGFNSRAVALDLIQPTLFLIFLAIILIKNNLISFNDAFAAYLISHLIIIISILWKFKFIFTYSISLFELKKYRLFISTISVSIEHFMFAFWLFIPSFYFNYTGQVDLVVAAALFQKIAAFTVAIYGVFSIKVMRSIALDGYFPLGFFNVFFIILVGEVFAGFVDRLLIGTHWAIEIINIYIEYFSGFFVLSAMSLLFIFLHMQQFLLINRDLGLRFYLMLVSVCLLGAFLGIGVGLLNAVQISLIIPILYFLLSTGRGFKL